MRGRFNVFAFKPSLFTVVVAMSDLPCKEGAKGPTDEEELKNPRGSSPPKADDSEQEAPEATTLTSSTDTTGGNAAPPLSKNQLKRKRRYDTLMALKLRKKQQEKERKIANAKAAGRDLEEERRQQVERTQSGEGNRRRQERWEHTLLPLAQKSFQVCLDCSFESMMTSKEVKSLALQIRYCYASNKRSSKPCLLSATSVMGETLEHLKNVSGFDGWHKRAFTCTAESLEEYYKDKMDKVVYLTSDSETTLNELENDKIYVIGGIVDRNRLKRAAITRAEALGLATAKLPISEHLQKMPTTRVLTCNHVYEILLKYKENGNDWKNALMDVLPHRKHVQGRDEDNQSNDEQTD